MAPFCETTRSTLAILTVVLLIVSPGEAARLPAFLCDIYRDTFINLGCVNRENLFCGVINGLLTDTLFGRPACDYFPCRLYGRNIGTCRTPSTCSSSVSDGICNRGSVCCTSVSTPGGGSSSASFALDNTDLAMGTFTVDDVPADFQDPNDIKEQKKQTDNSN